MQRTLSLLVLLGGLFLFCAAQQTIQVTSPLPAGWTIVGGSAPAQTNKPELILLAGAQLASSLNAGDVSLKITTRPTVGQDADNWPILEIGPVALTFARNQSIGKIGVGFGR